MRQLGATPWTRAPLLLWRAPGVVLALVVAAAILGIAGSSAPLFLGTAGAAEIDQQVDLRCPEDARPAATTAEHGRLGEAPGNPVFTPSLFDRQDRRVRAAMATAGLPEPYRVLIARTSMIGHPDTSDAIAKDVTVYVRDGALDHLTVLDRASTPPVGRSVFISDRLAESVSAGIGDRMVLGNASVTVAGVYRDLSRVDRLPGYWCRWEVLVRAALEGTPPPMVITDPATLRATVPVREDQRDVELASEWFAPVDPSTLTIDKARGLLERERIAARNTGGIAMVSELDTIADRAAAARDGLSGPVVAVTIAGTIVALLLVAAAGGYWAERRSSEVRLLVSRGVSPAALGVKALLEMAPAVLIGLAGGWLGAMELVRWLGPAPRFEPGDGGRALLTVAAVGAVGLLLLAVVAGLRGRGGADQRVRRTHQVWWRSVPWELTLIAAAVVMYRDARRDGVTVVDFLVHIPAPLIAFPLFGLVGCLLLVARVVGWSLPAIRRATTRLPLAGYLAGRRLTANPVITLALLVATAIPVGVFGFSAGLSASTDATIDAKIRTNIGADHVITTLVTPGQTPPTGGNGTVVSLVRRATFVTEAGSIVGVDPDTFGRFAATGLTSRPLPELLRMLPPVAPGEPVPAILVNSTGDPTRATLGFNTTMPIHVVDTEAAFPGLRNGRQPMLVVRRDALPDSDSTASRVEEIWTTDERIEALEGVILAEDVRVQFERQPADALRGTQLVTVTWTLGFLRALAILTGLIATAGLLLYLGARSRRRVASYVMSRRMGLRRGGHLRSLFIEITAVLLVAAVVGLVTARIAIALVAPEFDVHPVYPPPLRFAYPAGALLGLAVVVVAVIALSAGTAQRSADRARPAEVMRMGS